MTEGQKRLLERFSEPETRNGVRVSSELKKIWSVELGILEVFSQICKKHNLRWFAVGGTLIGAARHQGFVPWDDDIDVAMPRPDYDKFLRVAPSELKYPFELLNPAIHPHRYYTGISRICNSETAAISEAMASSGCRYNFGIFIDIIPLDGVSDSKFVLTMQRKTTKIMKVIGSFVLATSRRSSAAAEFRRLVGRSLFRLMGNRLLEWMKYKVCSFVRYGKTSRCGALAINFLDRDIWPLECFDEIIQLPFEYMMINCPAKYDKLLTVRYGDWRTCKPQEIYHEFVFYPDRPYKEVLKEKYGYGS